MSYPLITDRTVLVTGCSTGIGAATARVLRDSGWHVLPTARKPEDIEALTGDGFEPITMDMADETSVKEGAAQAMDLGQGKLSAVVNNAGYGQSGAIEDLTRDVLRYQFEVNVFGMQQLTNALIPSFRQRGRGRIVNISSVLGRMTIPFLGAYCASKHAMESLSDALRVELVNSGIAVALVEPGPIESSFRNNSADMAEQTLDVEASRFGAEYAKEIERRKKPKKKKKQFMLPPEAVAAKVLHALESARPQRRYCVTLPAYAGAMLRRFAPDALLDHVLAAKVRKFDSRS